MLWKQKRYTNCFNYAYKQSFNIDSPAHTIFIIICPHRVGMWASWSFESMLKWKFYSHSSSQVVGTTRSVCWVYVWRRFVKLQFDFVSIFYSIFSFLVLSLSRLSFEFHIELINSIARTFQVSSWSSKWHTKHNSGRKISTKSMTEDSGDGDDSENINNNKKNSDRVKIFLASISKIEWRDWEMKRQLK